MTFAALNFQQFGTLSERTFSNGSQMSLHDVKGSSLSPVYLRIDSQSTVATPAVRGKGTPSRKGVSPRGVSPRETKQGDQHLQELYKTKACQQWQMGKCRRGAACRFAHGDEELRQMPDLTKTKMCEEFLSTGYCSKGQKCGYAHDEAERRVTEGCFKSKVCRFYERNLCQNGDNCRFAHGNHQLIPKESPKMVHAAKESLATFSEDDSDFKGDWSDIALAIKREALIEQQRTRTVSSSSEEDRERHMLASLEKKAFGY